MQNISSSYSTPQRSNIINLLTLKVTHLLITSSTLLFILLPDTCWWCQAIALWTFLPKMKQIAKKYTATKRSLSLASSTSTIKKGLCFQSYRQKTEVQAVFGVQQLHSQTSWTVHLTSRQAAYTRTEPVSRAHTVVKVSKFSSRLKVLCEHANETRLRFV